jgi:replication initiation and membrane attachment protein DnaB
LGQNDQRVINHLFVEMRLPSGVVNALCEYVLERNDNVLDYWKCDELASALNRVGVKTARDAMEYLNSRRSKKKKSGSYRKKDEAQEEEVVAKNEAKTAPKEDEKEIADDISAMLDSIYNK